jgi:hypothetical protein
MQQRLGRLVVSVAEIREATTRILDAVEVSLGPIVNLDADHYWLLETDDSFDLGADPEVHAGQLSDDLESIRDMLGNADDDIVVWHDLDHLIGLLRRLSALDRP